MRQERSWLLIKHRDDWAGEVDITAGEFSKGVKSGGDFEDILAADSPAIWRSNQPAKGNATEQCSRKSVKGRGAQAGSA